jgi:hypothetical protein
MPVGSDPRRAGGEGLSLPMAPLPDGVGLSFTVECPSISSPHYVDPPNGGYACDVPEVDSVSSGMLDVYSMPVTLGCYHAR